MRLDIQTRVVTHQSKLATVPAAALKKDSGIISPADKPLYSLR